MPQERDIEHGSRFFLVTAWASPISPLALAAAFGVWRVGAEFEFWRGIWPFRSSFLVCLVAFLAGAVSFCGVRTNRVLWIVLPALFGLLLNAVVGFIMLVGWALSAGYKLGI